MCGIAGIFNGSDDAPIDESEVVRLTERLVHRGPDGQGIYVGPGIGLGHRRLAVIDLAGGAQPMWSSDGRRCIVFNGEIYNYQELARDLTALGFVFRTRSDTEVILNAWGAWGSESLARLSGMFAFALWDAPTKSLVLARDRVGKKPLYYALAGGKTLLFASELKALTASGRVPQRIAPDAVEDYLTFGYVPDPKTIYRDAFKLPPASFLRWQRGQRPEIESYWDFAPRPAARPPTLAAAAYELFDRLHGAVKRRLVADVPLGAFLSGGVDSSAVVAHMAAASNLPVKTCTIGFSEATHDERAHARRVAERFGTDHVELLASPDAIAAGPEHLDQIAALYDEPFADSSALPTYHVCRLARQRVTVALSGDGGDEAFGGYRRYLWHVRESQMRSLMPAAMRGPLFGALARYYPRFERAPRWLRARTTFFELSQDAAGAYLNNIATIPEPMRKDLYSDRFTAELQGYRSTELISELMSKADTDDPLLQAQYVDLKTWLAGRMLVKVDRASMANGLEVRSPFLDHDLIEWGLSLPAALKCSGGNYKIVLKKSLDALLPAALITRPKQGFSLPLRRWLAGPLQPIARAALTSPAMSDSGWFKPAALERLLDEHVQGDRDHSAPIWSLMIFERFLARQ